MVLLLLVLPLPANADEEWKRPIYLNCPKQKKQVLELVRGEIGTWDLEVIRARIKGIKVTAIAYDFAEAFIAPVESLPRKAPFVGVKKLPAELVHFVKEAEKLNRKVCLGGKSAKRDFEKSLERNRTDVYGWPAEPNAK